MGVKYVPKTTIILDANPAVTSIVSDVGDGMKDTVNAVLPIAGGVIVVIVGVYFGLKLFKKLTGARTS